MFCSFAPVDRPSVSNSWTVLWGKLWVVYNARNDGFAGFNSELELSLRPGSQHRTGSIIATLLMFHALLDDLCLLPNGKDFTRHFGRVLSRVNSFDCRNVVRCKLDYFILSWALSTAQYEGTSFEWHPGKGSPLLRNRPKINSYSSKWVPYIYKIK